MGDCVIYCSTALNHLIELGYNVTAYKYKLSKDINDYHYYIELIYEENCYIIDNDKYVYDYLSQPLFYC